MYLNSHMSLSSWQDGRHRYSPRLCSHAMLMWSATETQSWEIHSIQHLNSACFRNGFTLFLTNSRRVSCRQLDDVTTRRRLYLTKFRNLPTEGVGFDPHVQLLVWLLRLRDFHTLAFFVAQEIGTYVAQIGTLLTVILTLITGAARDVW